MEEPEPASSGIFPFEKAQSLPSSQIDLQFKTHVHQLKGLRVMSSEKLRADFRLAECLGPKAADATPPHSQQTQVTSEKHPEGNLGLITKPVTEQKTSNWAKERVKAAVGVGIAGAAMKEDTYVGEWYTFLKGIA